MFYYYREQAALKAKQYQRALDDMAKAIELNPEDLTYRAELAVVNLRVGRYEEALNVLNGIPFGERRARWYYFSAIANQGMGNNINAMEHAKRAVEMEPSNMEYRQFLQHLQYGGTWYTSMGSDYDRPYASAGNWCLSLLCLDLLCNCCCFRPF